MLRLLIFIIVTLLFSFIITGCNGQLIEYDGKHDNHRYFVGNKNSTVRDIFNSTVKVITKAKAITNGGPPNIDDGEYHEHTKSGTGVFITKKHILTVEHVIAMDTVAYRTPWGVAEVEIVKKKEERTIIYFGEKKYPAKVIFQNKKHDVALLEIITEGVDEIDEGVVSSKSFIPVIGNSDELILGNVLFTVGNGLTGEKNVRMGIFSGIVAPKDSEEKLDIVLDETFMLSNVMMPGDSGGPIFSIRDGIFELIGITQGTMMLYEVMGWGIRINAIKKLIGDAWPKRETAPYWSSLF